MLKPFLTGFVLLPAALRLIGAGAEVEFVTAGFADVHGTIPIQAESIWFQQPAGQEFVSALPRVDFIDLQLSQGVMPAGTSNHYKVILHADTITGPFVWASETVARPAFDVSVARFWFDPPVEITPWATYVIELVRVEPIEGWQDSPGVGFVFDFLGTDPALQYGGGRAVWAGIPLEGSDLYFRAGVMVPPMWSTNAVRVTASGAPQRADAGAVFENPFITTLNTATLTFQMDQPLGTNEEIHFNPTVAPVDPDTRVLSVFYGGIYRTVGVVLTNAPGDRSSLAMRFTTEPPHYVVGQILRSVEFVAQPNATNALWPAVRTNTLWVTFKHEAGEVTEALRVDFQETNQPPEASAMVIRGDDFLDRESIFFTRRARPRAEVSLVMQVTDSDSTGINVRWQEYGSNNLAGLGFQLSGEFRPGVHTLGGTVLDEVNEVPAAPATFEVLTPRQGVQQLRAAVRDQVAARRARLVAGPLVLAEAAVRNRRWNLAERQLRVFQRRAGRYVADVVLQEMVTGAAQVLINEALE